MGRGLSPLQRWMLQRAAERPDRSERGGGCDLTTSRVIHEFYKVPLSPTWCRPSGSFCCSSQMFRDAEDTVAAKRVRPAITHAVRRLEQRGLVDAMCGAVARWSGISLTDAGREQATLLNNMVENLPTSCPIADAESYRTTLEHDVTKLPDSVIDSTALVTEVVTW